MVILSRPWKHGLFLSMDMRYFLKKFNIAAISILVTCSFLLNSIAYGRDLPENTDLRAPVLTNSPEGTDRTHEALMKLVNLEESTPINLKTALWCIENFIRHVDENGLKIKDGMLLDRAIVGARYVTTMSEKRGNLEGGSFLRPAWNNSYHLLNYLASLGKTNTIREQEWLSAKDRFETIKSGIEKWVEEHGPVYAGRQDDIKIKGQKIIKKDIKKILLINAAPIGRGRDVRIPTSLYSLYASLRKKFGGNIEIKLLDLAIEDHDFKLENYLSNEKPDLVGISTTCSAYSGIADRASVMIKNILPETLIVYGGIHASVVPGEVAANPSVDFVMQGEGEIAFPEAIEVITHGDGNISKVGGLWYKNPEGEIKGTGDAALPVLDELPVGMPDVLDDVIWKYDLSSPYL